MLSDNFSRARRCARCFACWLRRTGEWWQPQPLPRKRRLLAAGMLVVLIAVGLVNFLLRETDAASGRVLPRFSRYADLAERKAAFLGYLLPLVREVNGEIARDRERLLRIREALAKQTEPEHAAAYDSNKPSRESAVNAPQVSGDDVRWLRKLAQDYAFALPTEAAAQSGERADVAACGLDLDFVDQLLLRVDVLPPSLVLAQAAIESAWGTSRFARQGNNLFGMRSYDGRGLVPRRASGAKFRVAAYTSPSDSVRAYFQTLNSQLAYRRLWALRAEARQSGPPLSGAHLANGLGAYSERGEAYVHQVQAVIQDNALARFDEPPTLSPSGSQTSHSLDTVSFHVSRERMRTRART